MSTQVEIVNLGLTHVSQKIIQALTDNTARAAVANRIWVPTLKKALRDHHWPFAKVVEELVLIDDYEPFSFAYGYAYPSNCLIMRKVYNESTEDTSIGEDWEQIYDRTNARQVIETDAEDAYGEYTYYVENTTLFDPSFVIAFSHLLAADFAISLNADKKLSTAQIEIYNGLISDAKRISAEEKRKPRSQTSSYEDARA